MNEALAWDEVGPNDVTLQNLEDAIEEDFPQTYSGQAWLACWMMYHQDYKVDAEGFLEKDGWSDFPCLREKDLDLTGFMVGWAVNALRHILKKGPVADGATLIIGGGDNQPKGVAPGPAATSMKVAIGGTEDE